MRLLRVEPANREASPTVPKVRAQVPEARTKCDASRCHLETNVVISLIQQTCESTEW